MELVKRWLRFNWLAVLGWIGAAYGEYLFFAALESIAGKPIADIFRGIVWMATGGWLALLSANNR